jgi:hypothetical protein
VPVALRKHDDAHAFAARDGLQGDTRAANRFVVRMRRDNQHVKRGSRRHRILRHGETGEEDEDKRVGDFHAYDAGRRREKAQITITRCASGHGSCRM